MLYTDTYTLSSSLMTQEVDDEILLMDMETQLFYELNPTGYVLWESIQKHTKLENVFAEMQELYEVSDADLKRDIDTFVDNLAKSEMIHFND